ncbi:DUF6895 family protein [Kitasatospora sp. NPDC059795]|uniref:DUF6895 family protein n=1 Tax=Kitasatospora sp. NPDC059795 TaxID=3346949 RepID=UPI00364A23B4
MTTAPPSALPRWSGAAAPAARSPQGGAPAVARALAWVAGALDRFDPPEPDRPTPATASAPLLELCVAARWLSHAELDPESRAAVERCLDRAALAVARPTLRHKLFRSTGFFQYYAWLLVLLLETGRLPEDERAALQRLVDLDHADLHNPSHPAHGLMELRYILDLGGLRHRLPGYQELYAADVLGAPVNPARVSEFEAYAVTHVVFYLSDMAMRPVHTLTADRRATASGTVEQLLALFLAAGHWDLVAELLLCRRALDMPPSPLADHARDRLLAQQLPDGSFPGPHYLPAAVRALPPDQYADYAFQRCYHTTLVAAMALTLDEGPRADAGPLLRPAAPPRPADPRLAEYARESLSRARAFLAAAPADPAPPVAPGPLPADPAGVLALLDADRDHLLAVAAALTAAGPPPAQAARLAEILPILACSALRSYDLPLAAALLAACAPLTPRSPAVDRALASLLAQQQPDGSFGAYAREASRLPAGTDPATSVHVPVTAACARALAALTATTALAV